MSFLYLYDIVDFDENGNIKKTKRYNNENVVASNFLYLICKYNQIILQNEVDDRGEKLELSPFFKEKLSPLLEDVEKGVSSKEYALQIISNSCLPKVQKILQEAKNDSEIISKLNALVSVEDNKFSEKVRGITNKKQQEYIMTKLSGELMDEISSLLDRQEENSPKEKSILYKKIIRYNGLVNATMNLQHAKCF